VAALIDVDLRIRAWQVYPRKRVKLAQGLQRWQLFCPERAFHQFTNGLLRELGFIKDGIHLVDDWQLNAVLKT
jgi:hypothetical protein